MEEYIFSQIMSFSILIHLLKISSYNSLLIVLESIIPN
ncbi:unnamed protein product [Tenebrio molitor]|nr:unnamed protein product [Tenebrio molitor]